MTDTTSTTSTPATLAVDALALRMSKGSAAREGIVTKGLPEGTTAAHVSLALRAARVMAGGEKPRGGSAQRINDTLSTLTAESTVLDYVNSARAVMEAHAAAEAKRRADLKAERKQLLDTYNDKRATLGAGREAAAALAAFDYAATADKKSAALEGLRAAITRALNAGIPFAEVRETVDAASPVQAVETVAA